MRDLNFERSRAARCATRSGVALRRLPDGSSCHVPHARNRGPATAKVLLVSGFMTQTGESPVVPVSDRDLDEVLRSLELEALFPDLALPRQPTLPIDRASANPAA